MIEAADQLRRCFKEALDLGGGSPQIRGIAHLSVESVPVCEIGRKIIGKPEETSERRLFLVMVFQ